MTAIAKVLTLAFPDSPDTEMLNTVALFSGIGLLASLYVASFGFDLSPGFF